MIQAKHSRAKAKALARANVSPKQFLPGTPVKVWDSKSRAYSSSGIIDSPVPGDDMLACSYRVLLSDGRLHHVHASWMVRTAAAGDTP